MQFLFVFVPFRIKIAFWISFIPESFCLFYLFSFIEWQDSPCLAHLAEFLQIDIDWGMKGLKTAWTEEWDSDVVKKEEEKKLLNRESNPDSWI